jgi:acyl-CoA hydrolase
VAVSVEVERWSAGATGQRERVTEAEVVLVAIGGDGRPIPIRPETEVRR